MRATVLGQAADHLDGIEIGGVISGADKVRVLAIFATGTFGQRGDIAEAQELGIEVLDEDAFLGLLEKPEEYT